MIEYPKYEGTMVQYGWNAGPHHAHILGLIRNIKVKLSGEEHGGNMTGKFWALLLYHGTFLPVLLPKKVIKPTHDAIAAAGLPVMASQENVQG